MPRILENYDIIPSEGYEVLKHKRTGEMHARISGNESEGEATKEARKWEDCNK